MSVTVTGDSILSLNFGVAPAAGILSGALLPIARTWAARLVGGNLADQINRIHVKTYPFVASVSQTVNLRSLADPFGDVFTDLAKIHVLGVRVGSSNDAALLTLGDDGTADEWVGLLRVGSLLDLRPGSLVNDGFTVFVAPNTSGYPVTTTSRLLKFLPSAHAFDVDLVVLGSN